MSSGLNRLSLNFQSLKEIWKLVGKKGACGDYSVATKGQYLKMLHRGWLQNHPLFFVQKRRTLYIAF